MSDKKKMQAAAQRVSNTRNKSKKSFWKRVWNIICWPFRAIAKLLGRVWKWICGLNLVAMVNLTLLVAIIVLFSMLIIDIVGCRSKQVIVVAKTNQAAEQVVVTEKSAPQNIVERTIKLPLKQNAHNNRSRVNAANVVPVKQSEVEIVKKQTANKNNKFWGDVIIDSRGAGAMLQSQAEVNGNLYLQNMRKYVLPCGIRINGNLFLRDVSMLQFCGDFVITGNIYVSPRSSFGPIPKTARLGGYVIL